MVTSLDFIPEISLSAWQNNNFLVVEIIVISVYGVFYYACIGTNLLI